MGGGANPQTPTMSKRTSYYSYNLWQSAFDNSYNSCSTAMVAGYGILCINKLILIYHHWNKFTTVFIHRKSFIRLQIRNAIKIVITLQYEMYYF